MASNAVAERTTQPVMNMKMAPADAGGTGEQALARANATPPVITTPDEYRASLSRWQSASFHVLSPAVNFSGLPPSYGMVAALVQINPNPDAGDVYRDSLFCDEGEVAIAKLGLSKIAQAAGMSIKTERVDPMPRERYYWEVRATVRYIGLDGTPQELDATSEYDLRDGSPRIEKMRKAAAKKSRSADAQIEGARTHGLRGCEARAINAAIRQFGIRQKYTVQELQKPFVAVRVMYQPDMSDPETRRQVTERALQGTTALYGAPKAIAAPQVIDVIGATDDEPRSVGSGATQPPADDPPAKALPEGFGLLQRVTAEDMMTRDGKRTFPKWRAVDVAGVEHVTIKKEFGEALERCFEAKRPVEIISTENAYGENEIAEVTPLGSAQNQALPGLDRL